MITLFLAWLLKRKSAESSASTDRNTESLPLHWRLRTRAFGNWFINLSVVRDRVPLRYRPALFFETFYSVGAGALVVFMFLSPVVLKTIIGGTERHIALLGAMIGGSSLLSPLVSFVGRKIRMRSLVVYPNLLVAGLLMATALPFGGATLFTIVVGSAFIVRVFPRVAEMNMYRVVYPATRRGAVVGWLRSISAVSGLAVVLFGYSWFLFQPRFYALVYCLVAVVLVGAALSYARIPISRRNLFARTDRQSPWPAFVEGVKTFTRDRRFVVYQFGFALAGFANHMAIMFVVQVLADDVVAAREADGVLLGPVGRSFVNSLGIGEKAVATLIVGFAFAVLPMMLMMATSPFWGRFLDRINPMYGRAIFNTFQCVAYGFHAYGGATLQIWPFFVGAALHAIGNGGGTINWLTGSLYFARPQHVSLYNAVHVCLTGLRGMLAPIVGLWLYSAQGLGMGANLFWVASALSVAGALVMLVQGVTDPGQRESVSAA